MRYSLVIAVIIFVAIIATASGISVTYPVVHEGSIRYYFSGGTSWSTIHDGTTGTSITTAGESFTAINTYSTADKFKEIRRGFLVFDTRSLGGSASDLQGTLCLYGGNPSYIINNLVSDHYVAFGLIDDSSIPPVVADYDNFNDNIYGADWNWSSGVWRNITIPGEYILNPGGYSVIGIRHWNDGLDIAPTWSASVWDELTWSDAVLIVEDAPDTFTPVQISVNILEKYSNAALINQAVTVTEVGGSGETKTSLYGETLHFDVVPGSSYWFNASRTGYLDYNETYTIPASPGIYNVYMDRILTPIANHSYAHFSVVDQTNGGLIPNAEIRLSDGQTKLTNSAGYTWFSVNNSEQINYYVSNPSGYWPAYGAMNLTADESILVALQRYTGPTATATMPGWTPVTVPTTGTGVDPVVTLSAQLRQQNVQEGMDVWYTNLPFISQFLFLLFIIGGLGLMAGGSRRN